MLHHEREIAEKYDQVPVFTQDKIDGSDVLTVEWVRVQPILDRLTEELKATQVARAVAVHWRDEYLKLLPGNSDYGIGTHPLGLVIDALDGETDPAQLGVPEAVLSSLAPQLLERLRSHAHGEWRKDEQRYEDGCES